MLVATLTRGLLEFNLSPAPDNIDSWDEINDVTFLSRRPSSQDSSLAFFDYWKKLIFNTIAKY